MPFFQKIYLWLKWLARLPFLFVFFLCVSELQSIIKACQVHNVSIFGCIRLALHQDKLDMLLGLICANIYLIENQIIFLKKLAEVVFQNMQNLV